MKILRLTKTFGVRSISLRYLESNIANNPMTSKPDKKRLKLAKNLNTKTKKETFIYKEPQ